jgi:hypothetical protein
MKLFKAARNLYALAREMWAAHKRNVPSPGYKATPAPPNKPTAPHVAPDPKKSYRKDR